MYSTQLRENNGKSLFENRGKPVDNVVHCHVTTANQECNSM